MGKNRHRMGFKRNSSWQQSQRATALDRRSSIRLGFLNVNGWSSQSKEDVCKAIEARCIDVFSLVETQRIVEDKDKIKMQGFDVFESKREKAKNDRRGGGLACMVRRTAGIAATQFSPKINNPNLQYVNSERLWVKYESQFGKTAVATVYISHQAEDNRFYEWNSGIYAVLADEIAVLRGQGFRIAMQGDYNAWIGSVPEEGGIPGNRAKVTPNGRLFLSFLQANNLTHLNGAVRRQGGEETRICQGLWTRHASDYRSSSVLDFVVLSSEHLAGAQEMVVDDHGHYGGASDHNMLFTRLADKFMSINERKRIYKPGWAVDEETDFTKFRAVVQREMDSFTSTGQGVENLSNALSRVLTKGLNEGVGRRVFQPSKQTLYPRDIVQLMRERRALEKTFKSEKCRFASSVEQTPLPSLIVAKENLEEKTEQLERAKAVFYRQRRAPLLNLARSKTRKGRKKFWGFVSRREKSSGDIPSLTDKDGILRHEPDEISKEVYRYLKQIFSGTDGLVEHDLPAGEEEGGEEEGTEEVGDEHEVLGEGGAGEAVQPESDDDEYTEEEDVEDEDVGEGGSGHPGSRDHEYGVKMDPNLPNSGDSCHPGDDPSGFLDKDFSFDEVLSTIKGLENGKAAGHDELLNEALKQAPESFVRKLTSLFNRVKTLGQVPMAWKRGRVVLVHKSGPVSDISNYRPITVLTSMAALYSKILNSRLTEVVERHKLLGEVQNGFRKDRSGADSVFSLNSVLWKSIAKQKKVNLAFLDLAKAYDSVDRNILWEKLAALGFGGQFLESIKSMYRGDYVTCQANGVTTDPVFLGRGLRQGCSLSPMLFALYVVDLTRDLTASNLGVRMYRVTISSLLFADDIVLVARDAEGLRLLLDIVQRHCVNLNMTLSLKKSKIISTTQDVWELYSDGEIIGCIDKTIEFKYLGVLTQLSPSRGASAMMKRAVRLAKSYRSSCISVGREGPDIVDLALTLWLNVAMPSILYGCELVPFTKTVIQEIERLQSSIGKFCLGLPTCAPNIATTSILGIKPFKELLYLAQWRFFIRLIKQEDTRWSKDCLLDHVRGGWSSPYIRYLGEVRLEVGMYRWPRSVKEVEVALSSYFLRINNSDIQRLSLPALEPQVKRSRMEHVNESFFSQVGFHLGSSFFLLPFLG